MPEVLGEPPSPRTALFWNGTAWQWALVDAAGHLQVDVIASGLPAGAATAANQALILAQVQAIEDLTHALQSINTDRLIVRGEDQLFSYRSQYRETISQVSTGAAWQTVSGSVAPPGEIWIVTSVSAINESAASTRVDIRIPAIDHLRTVAALAQFVSLDWQGHTYLKNGDRVQVAFLGTAAGNNLVLSSHGYKMTVET